jgi:biotin-dependent carboxylase-like uncharacterized protein
MSQHYIEIININGQASIQDLGRLNSQHLGFSASGAADEFAFLTANQLIADHHNITDPDKRQRNCAAIEITLGQISFRANAACIIAITGADCDAKINNITIKNWQCHQLQTNDIIAFAMPINGLHSYLAVMAGVTCQVEQKPWLGSFAQTRNEMALGFTGAPLIAGSKLYFSSPASGLKNPVVPVKANKPISSPKRFYAQHKLTLRVMPSALFLQMPIELQQRFLAHEYIISADSNRMGYRLHLKAEQTRLFDQRILAESLRSRCLLSMPVTYGMIQFPANEQPIILMKERQTMGGYPVLGTVMQTDLFRLSQMRPGEKVNFTLINHQQAQQQLRAFYQRF